MSHEINQRSILTTERLTTKLKIDFLFQNYEKTVAPSKFCDFQMHLLSRQEPELWKALHKPQERYGQQMSKLGACPPPLTFHDNAFLPLLRGCHCPPEWEMWGGYPTLPGYPSPDAATVNFLSGQCKIQKPDHK